MSEPIPAKIVIGGKLRRGYLETFCEEIVNQGVGHGWGERFRSADEVRKYIEIEEREGKALEFFDDQANYGVFEDLEWWCRQHHLSWDRISDTKYEYDGAILRFRPELNPEPYDFLKTQDGGVVVPWDEIDGIVQDLEATVGTSSPADLRSIIHQAVDDLRAAFGRDIPPVPAFEVVP